MLAWMEIKCRDSNRFVCVLKFDNAHFFITTVDFIGFEFVMTQNGDTTRKRFTAVVIFSEGFVIFKFQSLGFGQASVIYTQDMTFTLIKMSAHLIFLIVYGIDVYLLNQDSVIAISCHFLCWWRRLVALIPPAPGE